MNSDQLLNALTDCAQASTYEPDAETINAAIARIRELEAKLANAQKLADVLLDERNEEVKKVAYWSKAYDDAKREAWTNDENVGIDITAQERAELVVAWIKKQQENFFLGTLEMNLIAEFESAEREAYKAGYEKAIRWARTAITEAALFTQDKETTLSILDALKK